MKMKRKDENPMSLKKKYYGVMIAGFVLFLGIMTYYSMQFQAKRQQAKQEINLNEKSVDVEGKATNKTTETTEETTQEKEKAESKQTMNQTVTYNGKTKMTWPVVGNVILPYSVDTTVYFESLDQYRVNKGILIEAKAGTDVKALKNARVEEIRKNAEFGQMVVLNLGNEYTALYGQMKNLTVKEGDFVSKGQVIGQVAKPTDYYTLEGANLYLQLEKSKKTMNPISYLKE
ncbi:MAG: peptidoglycan DD-metalloendopeptidase family protein [Anaerostipes sp.]|jgi:septal ring factor EnvC (AmiA/AmiB activator)